MISPADFTRRLEALVLGGVGPGLPRRNQDSHVLLKAVTLALRRDVSYSERELGLALAGWLTSAGPRVDLDPVSLRRSLVDHGYLARDAAGHAYEVREVPETFSADVDSLDPLQLISSARERARQKAEAHRPPPG